MNFDDLINPGVRGAPITLPLKAFYGLDPKREDTRRRFYTDMARVHDFEGWNKRQPVSRLPKAGRNGRDQVLTSKDKRIGLIRDQNAGVVEYLEATTDIDDPVSRAATDAEKNTARHFGEIRRRVARKLRSLNERAEGAPLQSVDWMRTPTGNTGATTMTASKLQALDRMGEIRANLPLFCVDILDREIMHDEFAFLAHESKQARLVALEDLRFSLDFAAMEFREIDRDRMMMRWRQARELWVLRPAIDLARRTKAG